MEVACCGTNGGRGRWLAFSSIGWGNAGTGPGLATVSATMQNWSAKAGICGEEGLLLCHDFVDSRNKILEYRLVLVNARSIIMSVIRIFIN